MCESIRIKSASNSDQTRFLTYKKKKREKEGAKKRKRRTLPRYFLIVESRWDSPLRSHRMVIFDWRSGIFFTPVSWTRRGHVLRVDRNGGFLGGSSTDAAWRYIAPDDAVLAVGGKRRQLPITRERNRWRADCPAMNPVELRLPVCSASRAQA